MSYKKKIRLITCILIMMTAIIIIGPMDIFTHGFYYDEIDWEQIAADDIGDRVKLEDGAYEMTFVPQKSHMVGFEIFLFNQPDGNSGKLNLTIKDVGGGNT